jgi:hypothetical protein
LPAIEETDVPTAISAILLTGIHPGDSDKRLKVHTNQGNPVFILAVRSNPVPRVFLSPSFSLVQYVNEAVGFA